MTGQPQPHPLRCETCNHRGDLDNDHNIFGLKFCKAHNLVTEPIFRNQIKITGCASHSSAGAQQRIDAALLEILEVMEKNQGGGIHTGWILADPVFHKIALLQAGDQHE